MMSKSRITIDPYDVGDPADWLHNAHAGEMLWLEFMEPLDLNAERLAERLGVSEERIASVVDGRSKMDADLDLRLARYFRMSPGFFFSLQIDYELLEAKRAMKGELDRIIPRAA
jgi:addiction module HigA family antidote